MSEKYCRDCIYCRSSSLANNGIYDICISPGIKNKTNPVTGGIIPAYCFNQRSISGECGPEGEKFVKRESNEKKKLSWWKWWK